MLSRGPKIWSEDHREKKYFPDLLVKDSCIRKLWPVEETRVRRQQTNSVVDEAYWENVILQVDCSRDEVIESRSTIAIRRWKRHPLSFTTEGLIVSIDWILVNNDTHTIIRSMFLEGLLQSGGRERSINEVNVVRGKRKYWRATQHWTRCCRTSVWRSGSRRVRCCRGCRWKHFAMLEPA